MGLRQLLLEHLAQRHALLEALQGFFQSQLAAFELLHQGFQSVETIVKGRGRENRHASDCTVVREA